MGLKESVNHMKKLLEELNHDLGKADGGNKAASQRVRTNSIKFAKVAKNYRKESISSERRGGGKKSSSKPKKAPARKAAKGRAKKR
jgi:hypothetical protein